MTRTRNEWEAAHKDDVIWHRKLMTPPLREADSADLFLARRVEGGNVTGALIETPAGRVELSEMQVAGLLNTVYGASPEQYLNMIDQNYQPPTWDDMLVPIEDGDLMHRPVVNDELHRPGPSGFAIGDWIKVKGKGITWVARVNTYDETTGDLHVTDDTGDSYWTEMSRWAVIRVRTA